MLLTEQQFLTLESIKLIAGGLRHIYCVAPRAKVVIKNAIGIYVDAPGIDCGKHDLKALIPIAKYRDLEVGDWCSVAKVEPIEGPVTWFAVPLEACQ